MDLDEIREEFREGWREGVERGSVRDELHQLGAWTRRLPGNLVRFTLGQLGALWRATVALLRDTLRGSPVLLGLLLRLLTGGLRAAARSSATAPAPAVKPEAKPTAPAAEGQEQKPEEEAQLREEAPAGPPWKRRKAKPAPAKDAPAAAPAPARPGLADLAERAGIAFLALVPIAALGGVVFRFVGRVLAPYTGALVLVLVVAWCVAAAIVAPRPGELVDEEEDEVVDETPTENDHEKSAGEEDQETNPWPAQREAIRKRVEEVAAAGAAGHREAKGKGVPVDDLIAEFWPHGAPRGVDRNAVTELLERAGITVRPQMKFRIGGRQKTPPGVHVDDLANDLGHRPRVAAPFVPDLTPQPGPSRELRSTG
ncbi:hypothetical protein [Streptomyces canus]|uniref:hypothetical protein n=1 Tax=Streptomyces canus TaxID=58343 RepID=UPI002E270A32